MAIVPPPTLQFESDAWVAGVLWVAGVDEVGVGPLAGPVTAAAVALKPGESYPWFSAVRDSKVLTEPERDDLAAQIRATAHYAIGWASHEEIDRINIYQARRLCVMRALEGLTVWPGAVISDALKLPLPGVRPIVKADALSISVAAASIVAKVARDAVMAELCERYPGYGFCHNKGYPTPEHKKLLARKGPCPEHRRSYAPVRLAEQPRLPW
ncbi:hypothetical protein AYO38_08175 [bacterium SCGC AG-212-C10]|nr:hypothetical protein AYO38_08175 [bacterium SCGC AG-212-C10]